MFQAGKFKDTDTRHKRHCQYGSPLIVLKMIGESKIAKDKIGTLTKKDYITK